MPPSTPSSFSPAFVPIRFEATNETVHAIKERCHRRLHDPFPDGPDWFPPDPLNRHAVLQAAFEPALHLFERHCDPSSSRRAADLNARRDCASVLSQKFAD